MVNKSALCGLLLFIASIGVAYAAVGCTLNDPDRDVKRLFPESTGYRTDFLSIKEVGGNALYEKISAELGDTLDPIYESSDVPYSFYDVLKGKEVIAHIHGVNQKGKYGGMQLIIATDLNGKITAFFYQKMSSPEAGVFMNKQFTSKFVGLTLEDFLRGYPKISDPSKSSEYDFRATMRGLKKNLILLKELKLNKIAPVKPQ
ncbi:MAG: hypothetical protein NT060_03845 [Candidatus Omnitrophica bacterium]|nr:hypothetical protein [Candidatus Omnitrophota bacterium]